MDSELLFAAEYDEYVREEENQLSEYSINGGKFHTPFLIYYYEPPKQTASTI